MIEISHVLARRWLRQVLDMRQDDGRRLPEAQWTALEAHLESCEACRAYRDRLSTLERDARRTLRTGWDAADYHSAADVTGAVIARRAVRAELRRKARVVALGLLLMVASIWGLSRLQARSRPEPASIVVSPPTATPVPTPQQGEFRGVIAYEAPQDGGGSDIFLLNPGVEDGLVNLTSDPADDSDPAWSPDGEWLAYLSDRTGKREVFVVNVAGSKTVQLTEAAGIEWQGPLTWSADGKTIALAGKRLEQGHQRWLYLVPLDGSNAYPLAGSRGAQEPEFAPQGSLLAYTFSDGSRAGVGVTNIETGEMGVTAWEVTSRGLPVPPGARLDWSADAKQMIYTASLAGGQKVQVARSLDYRLVYLGQSQLHLPVTQSAWPSAYRAVTWSPAAVVVYLEDQSDARAREDPDGMAQAVTGCWTIQVRYPGLNEMIKARLPTGGLCVESGLDRASWTPDGSWLVLVGRTPDELAAGATSGIYAVRVPAPGPDANPEEPSGDDAEQSNIVRLADAPEGVVTPRVRSLRLDGPPLLKIDPRPVTVGQDELPPADVSAAAGDGEIVYVKPVGANYLIARTTPDGSGGRILFSNSGVLHCPRWSPGREKVAFVARAPGKSAGTDGPDEVLVMDRSGRNVQILSLNQTLGLKGTAMNSIRYGCPDWSSDGEWLAVTVHTGLDHLLAFISVRGVVMPRYVPVGEPAGSAGARWLPGTNRVVLAHKTRSGAALLAVDMPERVDGSFNMITLRTFRGGAGVSALAVSPDTWYLGLLASYEQPGQRTQAVLRRILPSPEVNGEGIEPAPPLVVGTDASAFSGGLVAEEAVPYLASNNGLLAWLSDGGLGVMLRKGAGNRHHTVIQHVDFGSGEIQDVARLEERAYGAAWSPGGRYLMVSSESGLWVVDIHAGRAGDAAPRWLSPEPVFDMDWK